MMVVLLKVMRPLCNSEKIQSSREAADYRSTLVWDIPAELSWVRSSTLRV